MPKVSRLASQECTGLDNTGNDTSVQATFNSTVSWETAVPGMTLKAVLPPLKPPPGLQFIEGAKRKQRKPGAGAAGAGGTKPLGAGGTDPNEEIDTDDLPPPNQPPPIRTPIDFIKRYWYLILPLMISSLMPSEPAPAPSEQQPAGQQGSGQQQGQGAAAPRASAAGGAAPAAQSPSSGSARQRRGKRNT
jgi:hypothetical protein